MTVTGQLRNDWEVGLNLYYTLIDWYLTPTSVFRYPVALHYTVSDVYERKKSLHVCLICLLVTLILNIA